MGAWGIGAFEDDVARAWLDGPFAEDGEAAVRAALETVLAVPAGQDIEAPTGVEGRAAAEVVAIVYGQPPAGLEEARRQGILVVGGGLRREHLVVALATKAVARIWSDASELHAFRTEGEEEGAWMAALSDITARLARAEAA